MLSPVQDHSSIGTQSKGCKVSWLIAASPEISFEYDEQSSMEWAGPGGTRVRGLAIEWRVSGKKKEKDSGIQKERRRDG